MKPISINIGMPFLSALACLMVSCTPTPGDGGRASIVGHVQEEARVLLSDPNTAFPGYPAADRNVFLIYGNNVGPDDEVETNHEGDFVFPWLRPGDYTVYVYSEDTSGVNPPRDMAVVQHLTIASAKETVVLDTLRIFKDL
ncbi:MAG: hypothetical protein CBC05_07830 [Crocinitomicaceae bacterium TMED45]|jgi:hypothetical protein|nr:MAG: hypothetical protein CBC05_07830 [Crocinitomicaceae bacterium TMED45]|tara:strand:+ start:7300 stop:7722 length:423 start_codon:yes stop_codon:yes gene_type:complete